MPLIFASSLLIFPSAIFGWMSSQATATNPDGWWASVTMFLRANFEVGEYPYILVEIILIYFVARQNTDVELSHLSADIRQNFLIIFKFHLESCIG